MGVTGLWGIVDGVGHPVNLETLRNQVIAIDLSLWVNQSIKGFRGRNGQTVDNAHVLGLFHRICKLLFYGIKPVFVFDGMCPQLKRNTVTKRAEQRNKAVHKSRDSSVKVLHNYLSSQLSSQTAKQLLKSDECLPSLESSLYEMSDKREFKIYEELNELHRQKTSLDIDSNTESDSDSDTAIAHNYKSYQNLDSIDINSDDFKALPLDMKYEILTDLKQKYKGYRNSELMPKESNEFSSYQMQRLLKKRGLQSKIEETISQLNGQITEDMIEKFDKKDFCFESDSTAGRLMSDENTRFIYFKKSQTSSSQIDSQNNIIDSKSSETSLSMASTTKSLLNESTDNSCVMLSVSEELDTKSNKKDNNFVKNSESSESNKLEIVKQFVSQESIQISDESDVENSEQPIETTEKQMIDTKSDLYNKLQTNNCNDFNRFTKIKLNEVNIDSESDEFEEVCAQTTTHLVESVGKVSDKESEELDLNQTNKNIIEEKGDESLSSFGDFELDFDLNNETKVISNEDKATDELKETLKEPEPSCSQSIPNEDISRQELMESYREMNKQNRLANHTTDQMMSECQELLKLFGIPYVVSPTEAEAQCAALEMLGLTNGTITDDSDVLLFGAQTVYKNFFTSSKFVELFKSCDIETRYGLTRSSMICIALLCGSDYTDGIDGVGSVTATEILSEFPGDGLKPLNDLKDWLTSKQKSKDKRPENTIRAKFLKIRLNDSFPNRVIFDAYMNPMVDDSKEKFLWAMPQLEELRCYASDRFGWSSTKTDSILLPVLKKVNEKQTQMTIDKYFKVQVQPKDTAIASKRLSKAINKLRGKEDDSLATSSSVANKTSNSLTAKVKNQRKKRQTNVTKSKANTSNALSKKRKTTPTPQVLNLSESSSESD